MGKKCMEETEKGHTMSTENKKVFANMDAERACDSRDRSTVTLRFASRDR